MAMHDLFCGICNARLSCLDVFNSLVPPFPDVCPVCFPVPGINIFRRQMTVGFYCHAHQSPDPGSHELRLAPLLGEDPLEPPRELDIDTTDGLQVLYRDPASPWLWGRMVPAEDADPPEEDEPEENEPRALDGKTCRCNNCE